MGVDYNNLIGQKFNKLTITSYLEHRRSVPFFNCVCDCGNKTIVSYNNLKYEAVKSCGCSRKGRNIKDLTGQVFDKLTVLNKTEVKNHKQYFTCLCECGNIIEVAGYSLTCNRIHSCGCTQSVGESRIIKILQKNNISYKKQFTFKDLLSEKGYPLKFDFAIFKNNALLYLIEYDGIQHFKSGNTWNTEEHLNITKKNDNLKNEYCLRNNIDLIRIKYNEKITLDKLKVVK